MRVLTAEPETPSPHSQGQTPAQGVLSCPGVSAAGVPAHSVPAPSLCGGHGLRHPDYPFLLGVIGLCCPCFAVSGMLVSPPVITITLGATLPECVHITAHRLPGQLPFILPLAWAAGMDSSHVRAQQLCWPGPQRGSGILPGSSLLWAQTPCLGFHI